MNAISIVAQNRSLSDEQVVDRVRRGETALFELLMRRHNPRVYRAARAIVKDEAEAEDVMQEAYVRAYQHLDDFEGTGRFAAWLTRIAVREALLRLRRQRAHTTEDLTALETEGDDAMTTFASS